MRRLALVAALALVPSLAAHADGCPPSTCGIVGSSLPGSRLLFLRPNGQAGPLVAYDLATRTKRFTLPPGMLAANGRAFVALRRSALVRYDASTGRRQHRWGLPHHGLAPAAVSSSGRWVVLARFGHSTTVAVVDSLRGGIVGSVELRGYEQPESMSTDGHVVYLAHYGSTGGYTLEHYDFRTRRLARTKLADPDEKMTGAAWNAVGTRDGHWLLTLYVTPKSTAFVHALDLRRGVAHCIDLPIAGSDFGSLGDYALALSPGGRRLYLANGAIGNLYVVDLSRLHVVRTVEFPAHPEDLSGGAGPNAAVSPRGRMLYFSGGGRFVWSYDTAYGRIRGPRAAAKVNYGVPTSVAALGVTPDGRAVVAVRTDHRLVTLRA
jgi:DNA-binding beta-propeller fold protein YncE